MQRCLCCPPRIGFHNLRDWYQARGRGILCHLDEVGELLLRIGANGCRQASAGTSGFFDELLGRGSILETVQRQGFNIGERQTRFPILKGAAHNVDQTLRWVVQ